MKMMLYCIYDSKANEYGPLFEAKNQAVAVRKCQHEFKDVPDLSDFTLFEVGEFDHESGLFGSYSKPVLVLELSDLFVDFVKEKVNE